MGVPLEPFAITEGAACIKNTGIAGIDLGRFTFLISGVLVSASTKVASSLSHRYCHSTTSNSRPISSLIGLRGRAEVGHLLLSPKPSARGACASELAASLRSMALRAVSVANSTLTAGADGCARPFRLAAVLERTGQYFDASSQTCRRHLRATIEKLPE